MLPSSARMRSGDDFSITVRRGSRFGTKTVVLHAWREQRQTHRHLGRRPLVGFVVSKAVGNAVQRNRVKRRLRHLVAGRLDRAPDDAMLVIRALPAAATEPARLPRDLDTAWERAARDWAESSSGAGDVANQPAGRPR